MPKPPVTQPNTAEETHRAPETQTTTEGENAEQTSDHVSKEEETRQESSESQEADMAVVHVITPSEKTPTEEGDNAGESTERRGSEDYSVAMSLAMLSESGSKVST